MPNPAVQIHCLLIIWIPAVMCLEPLLELTNSGYGQLQSGKLRLPEQGTSLCSFLSISPLFRIRQQNNLQSSYKKGSGRKPTKCIERTGRSRHPRTNKFSYGLPGQYGEPRNALRSQLRFLNTRCHRVTEPKPCH